jgi:hypothetical protein
MPKTSRTSKRRVKRTGSPKRTASLRKTAATKRTVAVTDDEGHVDGCDIDFTQSGVTLDADLPAAKGGVEIVAGARRKPARRRN